jgi:hypothetical protein
MGVAPIGLGAQTIRGVVVDDINLKPVPTARVRLLFDDEVRVTAETDTQGRFTLTSFSPGHYRIEVSRLGYETSLSQVIPIEGEDTVSVEFRVRPDAIVLSPLTIVGHSRRGRDQFERRRLSADRGIFITPEMVDSIAPNHPVDVLKGLEEVDVRWGWGRNSTGSPGPIPSVRTVLGTGCLLYLVDFMQVNPPPWVGGDWSSFLLGGLAGKEVVAVEVYRSVLEVPDELRRYTSRVRTVQNPRTGRFGIQDSSMCGLVVFWTKQGW